MLELTANKEVFVEIESLSTEVDYIVCPRKFATYKLFIFVNISFERLTHSESFLQNRRTFCYNSFATTKVQEASVNTHMEFVVAIELTIQPTSAQSVAIEAGIDFVVLVLGEDTLIEEPVVA